MSITVTKSYYEDDVMSVVHLGGKYWPAILFAYGMGLDFIGNMFDTLEAARDIAGRLVAERNNYHCIADGLPLVRVDHNMVGLALSGREWFPVIFTEENLEVLGLNGQGSEDRREIVEAALRIAVSRDAIFRLDLVISIPPSSDLVRA